MSAIRGTTRTTAFAVSRHPLAQLIRFGLGGVINTLFGYGLFLALLRIGMTAGVALIVTPLAGILFNFQTSKRLVFQSGDNRLLLRFALVYLVLIGINYAGFLALRRAGCADWLAQGLMLVPVALLSFALQRRIVFAPGQEPA